MKTGKLTDIVRETTGSSWLLPRKHVRSACYIIEDNEELIAAAPCNFQERAGLFIVSDMRLFFASGSAFGSIEVTEFLPKSVKGITYSYRTFSGSLTLNVNGKEVSIARLSRRGVTNLVAAIRQVVGVQKKGKPSLNATASFDEIEKPRLSQLSRPKLVYDHDNMIPSHRSLAKALEESG